MSRRRLLLRHLDFERVEFDLDDGYAIRPVVVHVGAGTAWHRAVMFPSAGSEGSESTGDPALDLEVRERAAEELVRLEAAVQVLSRAGRVA